MPGSPEGGPPSEIIPISHGKRANAEAYVSSSTRQMESCHLEGDLSTNCALAVTTAVAANTRRRPGADALGRFDRRVTIRAFAPHGSGRRGFAVRHPGPCSAWVIAGWPSPVGRAINAGPALHLSGPSAAVGPAAPEGRGHCRGGAWRPRYPVRRRNWTTATL